MNKNILFIIAIVITSNLSSKMTYAHGIWFAERSSQLAIIYGVGADDLDVVKRIKKFENIRGYDAEWSEVDAELTPAGPIVLVTSDDYPEAVSAAMNNGIYTKTQEGHWVAKPKKEVINPVTTIVAYKYAVHLRGPLRKIPSLNHQKLQVIPIGDSFPLLLGKEVTYQILFNNKPIKGAKVLLDFVNDPDAIPLITDSNGRVTAPIRNQGLNVVAAMFEGPSDNSAEIDEIQMLATLSYVLPHEPE